MNVDTGSLDPPRPESQSPEMQPGLTEGAISTSAEPQSQQLRAHELLARPDAGQGSKDADADMLQLFRCPLTKVSPQPLLNKFSYFSLPFVSALNTAIKSIDLA